MVLSLLSAVLFGFVCGIPIALVIIVIKKDNSDTSEDAKEDVLFICPVVGEECVNDNYADCQNCKICQGWQK